MTLLSSVDVTSEMDSRGLLSVLNGSAVVTGGGGGLGMGSLGCGVGGIGGGGGVFLGCWLLSGGWWWAVVGGVRGVGGLGYMYPGGGVGLLLMSGWGGSGGGGVEWGVVVLIG